MKFYCFCSVLILLFSSFFVACNTPPAPKTEEKPIARAGDFYLYPSDVEGIGSGMKNPEDSLYQLKIYVEQWVNDKLMLRIAQNNIKISKKMERMVEDYRADLIMTEYEKQLVRDQLDKEVTPGQLAEYYGNNKEQYISGISYIQCYFIKADRSLEGVEQLRQQFRSGKEVDFEKVKLFCAKHKTIHILNKDRWTKYDKIVRELPKGAINDRHRNGVSVLDRMDDNYVYLMRVFGYRDKNDAAPLPKVKDQITNIILHLRHKETLNSIRRQVFEEGKENSRFEIY